VIVHPEARGFPPEASELHCWDDRLAWPGAGDRLD
jgi:hypothetical protein